jgi:hypothetical protein
MEVKGRDTIQRPAAAHDGDLDRDPRRASDPVRQICEAIRGDPRGARRPKSRRTSSTPASRSSAAARCCYGIADAMSETLGIPAASARTR